MATHGVFRRLRKASAFLLIVLISIRFGLGAEILPPGFRPHPLGIHALTGGKVVIRPGEVMDGATIVIRDGVIKEIGKDVSPPPDARVWDMKGTVIYAGFIDSYLVAGSTNGPVSTADSEPVDSSALTDGGINFYGVAGKKAGREKSGP